MHEVGWLSERGKKGGVNFFLICFRKTGVPKKGGSLRKVGFPALEETVITSHIAIVY